MSTQTMNNGSVSSGDRLGFTFFLAAALHALLILGVSFKLDKGENLPPTLEITLATHKSEEPDKADFLAQHNQQASGTGDKPQQLTTERLADFADNKIRETNPQPKPQAVKANETSVRQKITTVSHSQQQAKKNKEERDLPRQQPREGEEQENPTLAEEIASLRAKVDRQRQAIANRPRIHRMTSVSAKSAEAAEYHFNWTTRIEQVGNRNFPPEAVARGIYGSLRLLTILNPDGSIDSVKILQPSGHKILDDAALQIVHLASPFEPFPPEIRQNYDKMEIIRTWHFELSGFSTSSTRLTGN